MTTTPAQSDRRAARSGVWTTLAARGAAVVVAAVAGAASFEHIASVAIGAGERPWVGYALPMAIDGLIVVGVAALLEDKRRHRYGRPSARLAVLVGVVATLAANLASAEPTWTARLVAITAPISFLLSVEVLTRTGRPLTTTDDSHAATAAGVRQETARPARRPLRKPAGRPGAVRVPRNAQRVARAVAETPDATPAQIAARLNLSERTAQRYWPHPPTPAAAGANGVPASRVGGVAPVPAAAFPRLDNRSAPHREAAR